MTPVLQVENLAKHFQMHHLGQRLHAFDGINFTLHAGEFLLLRGPNGVGKSTLLRTLYPPHPGRSFAEHPLPILAAIIPIPI